MRARELADYALGCDFERLPDAAKIQLKIRVLDTLGCALGALGAPRMSALHSQITAFDGDGPCTLIGGGSAPPDRAAFYNSALIRFLDCNDNYFARGETCEPSNNFGAVLAAAECAQASGKNLLDALTAAYQVQCLLADQAPLSAQGYDVIAHDSCAAAAGAARATGLTPEQTKNALTIATAASSPLALRGAGRAPDWTLLARPAAAGSAVHAVLMAARKTTGPVNKTEGSTRCVLPASEQFETDWDPGAERITRSNVRRFSGSVQAQSCIEGAIELRSKYCFKPSEIRAIGVDVNSDLLAETHQEPAQSPLISRERGAKSLPFMIAAALVDGDLSPLQYERERIARSEVQTLAQRIRVQRHDHPAGDRPDKLPCHVQILLKNGWLLKRAKFDYEGFHTRPPGFPGVFRKFRRLTEGKIPRSLGTEIADTVTRLEALQTSDLTKLLGWCKVGARTAEAQKASS